MSDVLSKLSAEQKRKLLERLLKDRAAQQQESVPDEFPLSAGQQGLWYAFRRDRSNTAYNVFFPSRFRSEINLDRLSRAVDMLVARHRALRTVFAESQDEHRPVQRVLETLPPEFEIIDASQWTTDDLKRRVLEQTQRPFDLTTGPLLRLAAFRKSTNDVVVVATAHHIVVDFWSLVLIMDEVRTLYAALNSGNPIELAEPPNNYHQFVAFQSEFIDSESGEQIAQHWRESLQRVSPLLEWAADFERPRRFTHRAGSRSLSLSVPTTTKLLEFAKQQRVTENAVVMALVQTLVGRFAAQDSFSIGTPYSGRNQSRFERTVGFFVNMLPITADLASDPTLEVLTQAVSQKLLDALSAEMLPFAEIVRRRAPARDPSHHPLFQVSCTFEKSQLQSERGRASFLLGGDPIATDFAGLRQESFFIEHPTCHYDLEFVFEFTTDGLRGMICYCRDLFAAETIETMATRFVSLTERLLDQPQMPVKQVRWETQENVTPAIATSRRTKAVKETVGGLLMDSDQPLVFQAKQFSKQLRRHGVRDGSIVPVCVPRGPEAWVGILGVLFSGAVPVPIDADQPSVLPEVLRQDANVSYVVGQADDPWIERLAAAAIEIRKAEDDTCDDPAEGSADDLAYVMYTSGSTGTPKGVMVAQHSIAWTLRWRSEQVRLDHTDRVLVLVSHGFDASMAVVLSTLHQNATPVWPRKTSTFDLDELIDQIIEEQITVLPAVPSVLAALASHPRFGECQSLRQIWSGGEPITHALIESIRSRLDCPIWNFYGPTEAAVEVTAAEVSASDSRRRVPIGWALDGARVFVLDEHLLPVPPGVPGQIAIAGPRLAAGYLNRPELTDASFVRIDDENNPATRIYLTGDRGRQRADGQFEFLGRLDHQVKLRGYRVELEEIESVMRSHPAVHQAAVKVVDVSGGDRQLAGYVAAKDVEPLASLRAYLDERLPAYKRPATVTILDALPVGASGKVIRDRLPDPRDGSRQVMPTEQPRSQWETFLAARFAAALDGDTIGIKENFFEAGGTSLQAATLTAELSSQLGFAVPTSLLFDLGSIAAVASRLSELNPAAIQERFGLASLEMALQARGEVSGDPLLAEFSPASDRPPVFMIHPPGGIVVCYRDLADRLDGTCPLVAIRSRGLHGDEALPESLVEMADDYARSIDARQPTGSLVLGGWSLGGVIAFAVVRQLLDRGRSVGGLILLDSSVPEQIDEASADAGQEYGLALNLSDLGALTPDEQLPFLYRHAERLGVLDQQAPQAVIEKTIAELQQLFAHHVRLSQDLTLQKIDVPTLLLRPRDVPGTPDPRPDRGWGRWTGPITVHSVAGHHHSMVQPPGVSEIAEFIGQFTASGSTVKKS